MQGGISQNLPGIQDFLTKTLKTGGIDNSLISQNLNALEGAGASARKGITASVLGSMPIGASAAASSLTKGLGDEELANRQAMITYLQNQGQTGLSNKFSATQGLEGLPGYIAQPSSIENAMIGVKSPYDLANLNSSSNFISQLLSGTKGSYYTPELNVSPSSWAQLSPLLGGLLKGLLSAVAMHEGGIVKRYHEGGRIEPSMDYNRLALAIMRR